METTISETLGQFKAALAEVASVGEALGAQEAGLRADEAAVLEQLLASVKPVMRYIDYGVRVSGHCPGNQFAHWVYQTLPEHGVILAGDMVKERNEDQNRGNFSGQDLVFTRSGSLLRRDFSGTWSSWQGESEYWETDATSVSAAMALSAFDLQEIVGELVKAIKDAITASEKKQRALAGRLERLQAAKAALA